MLTPLFILSLGLDEWKVCSWTFGEQSRSGWVYAGSDKRNGKFIISVYLHSSHYPPPPSPLPPFPSLLQAPSPHPTEKTKSLEPHTFYTPLGKRPFSQWKVKRGMYQTMPSQKYKQTCISKENNIVKPWMGLEKLCYFLSLIYHLIWVFHLCLNHASISPSIFIYMCLHLSILITFWMIWTHCRKEI